MKVKIRIIEVYPVYSEGSTVTGGSPVELPDDLWRRYLAVKGSFMDILEDVEEAIGDQLL